MTQAFRRCPSAPGPWLSSLRIGVPIARALAPVVRFVIWDQVRIEIGASRTVHLKAPGQSGKYVIPPNSQLQPDHPLGMLMRLAADGEWRNPPLGSAECERVSRAFRRLRKLLMALVPLPGDPFQPHRGRLSQSSRSASTADCCRRTGGALARAAGQ
jgi:hypothetical protein